LRFIPKETTLRPIVRFTHTRAVTHKLKQVKSILDFVISTKPWCMAFGMNALRSFHPAYSDFALRMRTTKSPLYWAAGDVSDCFTSLDHSILESTLRKLLGESDFTCLSCWAKLNTGEKTFWRQIYSAGRSRHEAGRQLRLRKRELLASNPLCSVLSTDDVIRAVRRYVTHAHLKMRSFYQSNRGIPQGNSLSWVLCNLYLGAMERKIFEHRPRDLFCRRYVDDYLVVSANRDGLLKFGRQLVKGSGMFGIRFNYEKMLVSPNVLQGSSVLTSIRKKEKMRWCGMAFNTKSMSVSVDSRRYRPRISMMRPPRMHPSEKVSFILTIAKRLISSKLKSLSLCNEHVGTKHQMIMGRGFLDFCFKYYFLQFSQVFRLDLNKASVRLFFEQLVCWASNRFKGRYFPSAGFDFSDGDSLMGASIVSLLSGNKV